MSDLILLTGPEVAALLRGQEAAVAARVWAAYALLNQGAAVQPEASFLRFRNGEPERAIALTGLIRGLPWRSGRRDVAGCKWVASVPGNVSRGLERASAVLVLNDPADGRPFVIMEGSIVSAERTAASAALAARSYFRAVGRTDPEVVGLVGLGPVNAAVLRHLKTTWPGLREVRANDTDGSRLAAFRQAFPDLAFRGTDPVSAASADLCSFATSAAEPWFRSPLKRDAAILHLSLRDLDPALLGGACNVTDGEEGLNPGTSLGDSGEAGWHLPSLLARKWPAEAEGKPFVFSPFGMGILDVAVGSLVDELARARGYGESVPDFFPTPWGSR